MRRHDRGAEALDRINRRGSLRRRDPDRPRRSRVVALLLAGASVVTLDVATGASSPLDPLRHVVGEALAPAEQVASAATAPVRDVGDWWRTRSALSEEVDALSLRNAELEEQARTAGFDRNRLAEYDELTAAAGTWGRALVPARVVAVGATQTFSRTVSIDAGTSSGLRPDMTVVNGSGLVGRVVRVGPSTATVLLVVDAESVVGGRVGESMKVGFLHGRGSLDSGGRLDLELVDGQHVPQPGESVVTWGSQDGAPYVSGIPVGEVTSVFTSLRETTQRAEIAPYVDFGSLDVVGVVVPSGTRSDRALVEADGSLR